ncbi:MAG: glutathione S-transferase family protein [Proteobacteria bacterium]|nr:glutathione S-transferase family protein [Pseudomonadota bacterium]MBS0573415.1 glutathione S-transferase family protein [Pseudomonadota bacterium]
MYVLHYSPDTASVIVRLALEELGQPYQARRIDREAGELASPAYRALHPLGLIPAFESPDGPMFETAAILLYLSEKHRALAPQPGSPGRAAFLKWLFFTSTNIHPTLLQLFYPERTAGPGCTDAVLAHASDRMRTYLGIIDAMIARDAPDWLSPGQPSVLGYYLGVLVRWLSSYGTGHPSHFSAAEFPALNRVLAAHEARPAALRTAEAEGLGPTIFTAPVY